MSINPNTFGEDFAEFLLANYKITRIDGSFVSSITLANDVASELDMAQLVDAEYDD